MNAPEKLYILPRQGGDYAPYWKTDSQDGFGIKYIRKDAMLEWAKEKKKQLFEQESENDEPSDVAAGINAGLDMVIDKLNSM